MTSQLPAHLIGANAVETLHRAGYRIVPTVPSIAMRRAAAGAMHLRREAMGGDWFYVSNVNKAALRWTAMLGAWHRDREGLKYAEPEVPTRWSWASRFFSIAIGWARDPASGSDSGGMARVP